jgi:serine/threonine protein kinase
MYENEVDIYSKLPPEAFEHIVSYLGSLDQQGRMTLLLEYVEGGNLQTYFANTQPPRTPSDRLEFWNSFFCLLKGLDATHNLNPAGETGRKNGQWLLKGCVFHLYISVAVPTTDTDEL